MLTVFKGVVQVPKAVKGEIILVLGGTRSGKSEFAEAYALHKSALAAYVATAEITDAEMARRVKIHQGRRKKNWLNFEAPYEAALVLKQAAQAADCVLFDSVTVYLGNFLYGKHPLTGSSQERCDKVMQEVDRLLEAARAGGKTVIFVSGDLGGGIIPANAMGREFQDLSGLVNQKLGAAAEHVFYSVAGQTVDIKKLAFQIEEV